MIRVGVFDSGVGGLSILSDLHATLPGITFDYCSDLKNFPYGTKSDQDVEALATDACLRFVEAANLDAVVIACGTASTVALPSIRLALTCPVIGVVPAIKPAAAASKSKSIGVLATKATIKRPYLQNLISEFAADCQVTLCGSSVLVELAERKVRGESVDIKLVKQELAPLFMGPFGQLDSIVLGCTHFPLLHDELASSAPWLVAWVNSSEAISRRVAQIFDKTLSLPSGSLKKPSIGYATGDASKMFPSVVPRFVQDLGLLEWRTL